MFQNYWRACFEINFSAMLKIQSV